MTDSKPSQADLWEREWIHALKHQFLFHHPKWREWQCRRNLPAINVESLGGALIQPHVSLNTCKSANFSPALIYKGMWDKMINQHVLKSSLWAGIIRMQLPHPAVEWMGLDHCRSTQRLEALPGNTDLQGCTQVSHTDNCVTSKQ